MNPFARQVQSYYTGTTYQRQQGDTLLPVSDQQLRKFAMGAYNQEKQIGKFKRVPALSTDETSVYIDPITKRAVVSFRGSKTKADWLDTDVNLFKGNITKTARFNRSKQELNNAAKALHGYDIVTTGHSMGSKIGEELSTRSIKHVGFNTGYGLRDTYEGTAKFNNSRSYINDYDYVSKFGRRNDNSTYYAGGYLASAHRRAPTKYYK